MLSVDRKTIFLATSVLALAIILLYFQSLSYGFIWDDFTYILNSKLMSDPNGLKKIWTQHSTVDFWPVAYSVLWICKQAFGNEAFGYHIVNLILYITTVILVWKTLNKLGFAAAWWIALLFALHPMNVEVVVWIFQIKTNLANMFALISTLFWIEFVNRYLQNTDQYLKKDHYKYYFLSAIFLILSFLSKVSLVGLTVLFAVYLFFKFKAGSIKKVVLLTGPLFLITFAVGLINIFWEQNAFPTVDSELILEPSMWFRFALVGKTYFFYLFNTFWPHPLTLVHPRWVIQNSIAAYLPTFILFAILIGSVYLILKKKFSLTLIGLFTSFCLLFPVLGLFEIYFFRYSFVAEHWLGIAMLGFLAPTIEFLFRKSVKKIWFYAVSIIVAIIFFVLSLNHIENFSTEQKLLEQNISLNPQSLMAHNTLALVLKNKGDNEGALINLQKAININPNAQSYYNIAAIYDDRSQLDQAKLYYEKAIQLNPYFSNSYNNLGAIYAKLNLYEKASELFTEAIKRDETNALAYYNLGYAYERQNQKINALKHYQKALELSPDNLIFKQAVQELREK